MGCGVYARQLLAVTTGDRIPCGVRLSKEDPVPLTEEQMLADIKDTIENNKIAVFMKGTPAQPRCGFSAAVVDILNRMNVPFVGVDAIEDPRFRHVLSAHTKWPTLPQVFVGGKLIGGCDIVREMKATGELDRVVAAAIG
jgi:monothiol glutaredoxin